MCFDLNHFAEQKQKVFDSCPFLQKQSIWREKICNNDDCIKSSSSYTVHNYIAWKPWRSQSDENEKKNHTKRASKWILATRQICTVSLKCTKSTAYTTHFNAHLNWTIVHIQRNGKLFCILFQIFAFYAQRSDEFFGKIIINKFLGFRFRIYHI